VTEPAAAQELPLLIGGGLGERETLLLVSRPASGQVELRRWSADDWSSAPTSTTVAAATLLEWIEAQATGGRTLNQSLYGVRLWLTGDGLAPRIR
jgi:hypothetical protein